MPIVLMPVDPVIDLLSRFQGPLRVIANPHGDGKKLPTLHGDTGRLEDDPK